MRYISIFALLACNADKGSQDSSVEGDADADSDTDTDTDPDTDCATDQLAVTAGTGAFAYEPLADGDRVTIVHGPQGGWHLWVAGALTGTAATSVLVAPQVTVVRDGTQLAGEQEPQGVAVTSDGCGGTFYGGFAYLDDYTPEAGTLLDAICRLDGELLELTITVTDPTLDATTTATVEVVADRDPYDEAFCK